MTKIAILNDTHCSARNSSLMIQKVQERFYAEQFFPYLEKHKIKHILHLGDYYDSRKFISVQATHANRKMFLNVLRERQLIMDIIPGNHDVLYTNTNDVCSLKELLGFFTDCVNIHMDPGVIDFDGHRILTVPWITDTNREKVAQAVANTKNISLCVGHFEFNGFSMQAGGIACDGGISTKDFEKYPMTLSGHFHTKSHVGSIHYLGTQFEMTWADYNDPKYFHVYDTKTGKLTAIRNPDKLFYKVDYNNGFPQGFHDINLQDRVLRLNVVDRSDDLKYRTALHDLNSKGLAELTVVDSSTLGISDVNFGVVEAKSNTALLDEYVVSMGLESAMEKTVNRYMLDLYDRAVQAGSAE